CLEKQRIREYRSVAPEVLPPSSGYFKAMNEAASALGFQPSGLFAKAGNGAGSRVQLALWLSGDNKSLLCIWGGKVARIDYKRTCMVSNITDDKSLVTVDQFGSDDISGAREIEVVMNADLAELHGRHIERLTPHESGARTFASTSVLSELEELESKRVDRLVAL